MLPGLLGLNAAKASRVIIDTAANVVYMAGPGVYELLPHLPAGTRKFNCVTSPSGHMMLPCAEFAVAQDERHRGSLTLHRQLDLLTTADTSVPADISNSNL